MKSPRRKKRLWERNVKLWLLLLVCVLTMLATGADMLSFTDAQFATLAWLSWVAAKTR